MSLRDELRAETVGASPTFASVRVKLASGKEVEVREPSHSDHAMMRRLSMIPLSKLEEDAGVKPGLDTAKFRAHAVILCTYDPESGKRVFEAGDLDALLQQPTSSGWFDTLANAVSTLILAGGDAGKASPVTKSDTSSS